MPVRAFRFLHAANLRLDAVPAPHGPVPDDLQTVLDEATATAFSHLISLAIEQDVDAILITGDTFDAAAGSLSAEVTLQRELRRLAESNLPVCITPGMTDSPSAWRDLPPLPGNVTIFLAGNEPGIELTDDNELLATVLPISAQTGHDAPELERIRHAGQDADTEREFMIGLWIPDLKQYADQLSSRYFAVDYLAAGSQAKQSSAPLTDGHVQFQAGSQGLSPDDVGWHGCRVIDVDESGQIHTRLVPLAPVRWETCQIDSRGVLDRDELCERMLAQLELLPGYTGEKLRIITWPLDQAMLETAGIKTEQDLHDLQDTLLGLTDQPKKGLRYLHRLEPVWDETRFPAAVDRELWQDFLSEMERSTPLEVERLQKLWEQHSGSATTPAGWPTEVRWPPVSPERVRRRALQHARQWFSQTTGGPSR